MPLDYWKSTPIHIYQSISTLAALAKYIYIYIYTYIYIHTYVGKLSHYNDLTVLPSPGIMVLIGTSSQTGPRFPGQRLSHGQLLVLGLGGFGGPGAAKDHRRRFFRETWRSSREEMENRGTNGENMGKSAVDQQTWETFEENIGVWFYWNMKWEITQSNRLYYAIFACYSIFSIIHRFTDFDLDRQWDCPQHTGCFSWVQFLRMVTVTWELPL